MYRIESYRRLFARIHMLEEKRRATFDPFEKLQIKNRIDNLKNIIIIVSAGSSKVKPT